MVKNEAYAYVYQRCFTNTGCKAKKDEQPSLQDINTWELHCKAAATHRGNVAQHARIVKTAPGNHMTD